MPDDRLISDLVFSEYKKALKRAEEAMRKGNPRQAAAAYRQCAELYSQYARASSDPVVRRQRQERAQIYLEKANTLEKNPSAARAQPVGSIPVQAAETPGEDDYETEVLNLLQKSTIRWDEIGGLEDTKRAIKMAYGLALASKPEGVKLKGWRNILLFGPPGTGKTLLAAATAGSLDASFFNVKVSNLLSKYFGESTKLISALYTVARRMSPAVVFLDEFESLVPPRGGGESGAERRIVSTFLAELDGLAGKDDESFILTMAATNLPGALDNAILSRFQKRIYIPLPDKEARRAIFNIHLERRGFKCQPPLETLVERSENYSGRDLEQLCQTAITAMIARLNDGLEKHVEKGLEEVRKYRLKVAPLSQSDFDQAFEQVKPTSRPEDLLKYTLWMKETES